MAVLLMQALENPLAVCRIDSAAVHHRHHKAHMGNIQYKVLTQQRKALCRQQGHFRDFIASQIAHTFQTCLGNLPDGMAAVRAVDILIII